MRVWLIKKRWRRHTIAVVAFLRLQRTLDDLRLVRKFVAAAQFMTLMANRPKLSLKRAREIRRRNGAIRLQQHGRRLIEEARYHRTQWATRLVERLYRGHMARKRNGGRLAEIRQRRKEDEESRRLALAEEKKAKDKEEADRIREMARSTTGAPLSTQSAARYNSKVRPTKEAGPAGHDTSGRGGGGGGGVMSEEMGLRLKKLEEAVSHEMPELRKRVQVLEAELTATKLQLEQLKAGGRAGGSSDNVTTRPDRALRQRSTSSASMLQPAVAAQAGGRSRRASVAGSGSSKTSWGLLDLLGITQPAAAAGAPSAVGGAAGGASKRASVARPHVTKHPTETLAGLQTAARAIEKHFGQAEVAGSNTSVQVLGDDSKNKDIAVLVRGQLCTALSRVLLHGFKSYKLIGRYHIWDFVQESCEATSKRLEGHSQSEAERTLLAAVINVNSHEGMANNPNIKFRSFVCCGLNDRLLHEWVRVLTVDKETMAKFYEGTPAPRPCRAVQCRDALGARSTHAHAHLPRHSSRAPLPPHSHLPLPPSRVARPSDAVRMRAPAVRCSVGVCQLVVGGLAAAERVARASQHVRLRAVARLRAQSMGSALSLHAQRGRRVG